jgi:diguanylate cyclase (GGDEF)-like protein
VSTGRPEPSTADSLRAVRGAEAALLSAVSEALVAHDDEAASLERLLVLAAGLLDGAVTAVAILDPDRGVLAGGPSRGFDTSPFLADEMAIGGSSDALAIAARTAAAVDFPSEHVSPTAARAGIGGGTVFPLVVRRDGADLVVGVLLVAHADGRELGPDERRLATGLAGVAAAIVERGLLTAAAHARAEWRERLSQIDPLTGLANRRTFDRIGELEVARAVRQETPLAVVVVDVDGYRTGRDAWGRETGDDVLRNVAAAVGDSVRLVDTVGRLGDDEFVVLAPGNGGDAVARRIIDAITGLEPVGGWRVRVTAGVAHVPTDGTALEELLAAAEAAIGRTRATADASGGASAG